MADSFKPDSFVPDISAPSAKKAPPSVTPTAPTRADLINWLIAQPAPPGTPEGQRIQKVQRALEADKTRIEKALPYAALGLMPGGATIPEIIGAAAGRMGAAGVIGAGQSVLAGESPLPEATKSALWQGVGEIAAPPVAMLATRLTSRPYNALSDYLVDRLIAGAKRLVPWWKDFPAGQEGFKKLMQDEGIATLRREYGEAFRKVVGDALKGERIPLSAEDAAFLNLAPKSGAFPSGNVLVDADEALLRANLKGATETGAAVQERIKEAVGSLVGVLKGTKPQAALRIQNALSGETMATEREYYREGMNLIQALRTVKAQNPSTYRLDPENIIKGLAASKGLNAQTVWERYLTESKAPGARELLLEIQQHMPRGAPKRVEFPFASLLFSPHLGRMRVGEHLPFTMGYSNIPRTAGEQELIHQWAPTVAGSLARGVGDVIYPPSVRIPPLLEAKEKR